MEKILSEDYCSYEVSKLLNEKGFNGMCDTVIGRDGTKYDIKLYDYVEEETTSCPTHQMAMKWLREEYNIDLLIGKSASGDKYIPTIHKDGWYMGRPNNAMADTYEAAVEYGLKYILENLI